MSQYEGMDTIHSRACLHRACPDFKCVGGDPSKNAEAFFQELRVRRFNRWVREQRRNVVTTDGLTTTVASVPFHFYCGSRHPAGAPCLR